MKKETLNIIEKIEKVRGILASVDVREMSLFVEVEDILDSEILFDEEIETSVCGSRFDLDSETSEFEQTFYDFSKIEELESDREEFLDYMMGVMERKQELLKESERFLIEHGKRLHEATQGLLKIAAELETQITENDGEKEAAATTTTKEQ